MPVPPPPWDSEQKKCITEARGNWDRRQEAQQEVTQPIMFYSRLRKACFLCLPPRQYSKCNLNHEPHNTQNQSSSACLFLSRIAISGQVPACRRPGCKGLQRPHQPRTTALHASPNWNLRVKVHPGTTLKHNFQLKARHMSFAKKK